MIERLAFDKQNAYNAIEASSHMARYSVARPLCAGARVLDIACGQGYGSWFLRAWGAAEVVGVDIAADAIAAARAHFADDAIHYHCHPAEKIDELFAPGSFDLVVCLETIEHVADAEVLLQVLRRQLKPDGALVLSCPNDYWYYPAEGEGNPFHRRKFHLAEFQELAERVFGPANLLLLGTPISGFANFPLTDQRLRPGADSPGFAAALQHLRAASAAAVLPSDEHVGEHNCSYFVGVWCPRSLPVEVQSAILFPCSMNASAPAAESANVNNLREEVIFLRSTVHDVRASQRWLEAQLATRDAAARVHATALADREHALAQAHDEIEEVSARYREHTATLEREAEAANRRAAEDAAECERLRRDVRRLNELETRLRAALAEQQAARQSTEGRLAELESLHSDYVRRIDNVERLKRIIPIPLRGLFRRIMGWR